MVLVAASGYLAIYNVQRIQSPTYDEVGHYLDSVYVGRDPSAGRYLLPNPFYPFFGYAVGAFFNWVGGFNRQVVTVGTSTAFLAVLTLSTADIARRSYGAAAGLLAGTLVLLYPTVIGQAAVFMLDVPLAAMVSLAMWSLLRTDGFADRRGALLFGVVCALGALTNVRFGFFVAIPLVFVVLGHLGLPATRTWLRHSSSPDVGTALLSRLRNLLDAAFIAVCVGLPWYLTRWHFFLVELPETVARNPYAQTGSLLFGIEYYVGSIWYVTSFLLAAFFLAGLIPWALRPTESRALVAIWLVAGILVLSPIAVKEPRYLVPIVGAIAVITSGGLRSIGARGGLASIGAGATATVTVGAAAVQLYAMTWGIAWLPQGRYVAQAFEFDQPVAIFSQRWGYLARPQETSFNIDAAAERVLAEVRAAGRTVSIRFLAEQEVIDAVRLPLTRARLIEDDIGLILLNDYAGPAIDTYPADYLVIEAPGSGGETAEAQLLRYTSNRGWSKESYTSAWRSPFGLRAPPRELVVYRRT